MDALKRLYHPSERGSVRRLPLLVEDRLLLFSEGVAQLPFGQGVDHECQGHEQG